MADYTYSEIMKMQNDAIKRVEEMQKKARKTVGLEGEAHGEPKKEPVPAQEPKRVPMPNDYLEQLKEYARNSSYRAEGDDSEKKTEPEKEKPLSDKGKNSFLNLQLDDDKTLLLALIMLLSEEGADELLIMALIYMLT